MDNLVFIKTGKEIKAAIQNRKSSLKARLDKRNQVLDEFLLDQAKVRSYIVRGAQNRFFGHEGDEGLVLVGSDEISSEEHQEIQQMCARIHQIEQELHRLSLIETHLGDNQKLELDLSELMAYGFSAQGIANVERN